MSQSAAIFLGSAQVEVTLPSASSETLPGIPWGAIGAFPTPAYWAYQVIARRVAGAHLSHRLGNTLQEEVAACLLGGHGIPAAVGLAAFQKLRALGLLTGAPDSPALLKALSEPIALKNGNLVRYRFARQKAHYLGQALAQLGRETPPLDCGRSLRDWLVNLPGIGFKTASWVARNWLDADDIAILDIHVLRAGALGGFFDRDLRVERDYLRLEEQFIRLARALGVRSSELDAVIWLEMMSSPTTVRQLMGGNRAGVRPVAKAKPSPPNSLPRRRTNKRPADTR